MYYHPWTLSIKLAWLEPSHEVGFENWVLEHFMLMDTNI